MRRAAVAHWELGFLLLFAGAMGGCKRSSAAQPPYKPPETPVPPEPCLTDQEAGTRSTLLKMFQEEKQPLLEPGKAEAQQFEAKTKLIETFERWLPERLRKRIDVSRPICLDSKIACYVDVKYLDWKTFAEVSRSVLEVQPPSPFMMFPGSRYGTGRVHIEEKDRKYLSSWVLALQLRPPEDPESCKQGRRR